MTRINANISSLQAIHRLLANQADLTTRMQRLSTGLRINAGGDDPAGLIASETLRFELVGINQAIENSNRAINVLATADAALSEVSSLLLDLRGLIDKSANDGAVSEDEIEANQLQIDSILESINRIANTTRFGNDKLLDGNLSYILSNVDGTKLLRTDVYGARLPSDNSTLTITVEVTQPAQRAMMYWNHSGLAATSAISIRVGGLRGYETFNFGGSTTIAEMATGINMFKELTGVSASLSGTACLRIDSIDYGSDAFVSVTAITGSFTMSGGDTDTRDQGVDPTVLVNGQSAATRGMNVQFRRNGLDLDLHLSQSFATATGSTSFGVRGGGARFQIGPDINSDAQLHVGIPAINTSTLGDPSVGFLKSIGSGETYALKERKYADAEAIVKAAIVQVAVASGRLGGIQRNQLEPNIRAQQVTYENVKASESAIRDTEYASEVAAMTRAQILVQSTVISLQIANQLPQNILALLGA